MTGEQGQEDEDATSQKDGVENDRGLVERDDDGDGVCLEKGETREEEKVCRVGLALPIGEKHESDGAEQLEFTYQHGDLKTTRIMGGTYGNKNQSRVRLDPSLVSLTPKAKTADDTRDDQLGGQDGVDLADELVPYLDGGLSNRAAELEVIGDVVLAAARLAAAKETICVLGALGLIGRWSLTPGGLIRVLGRRSLIFGLAGHVCDVEVANSVMANVTMMNVG